MDKDFKNWSELKIFLSYFKPHRKLFYLDMVSALLIAMIDLAFPWVSRWCMYTLLPDNAWRTFWTVMLVVTVAYALRSVFYYIICYWGHNFGARVEADIRRDLFRHIQELNYGFFDHNRVGQLMSRLTTDLFDVTEMAHHAPEDLFISTVTILGALILMFRIQWRLALVLTLMLPIFLAVVMLCRLHMRDASRQVKVTVSAINTEFESELSGIRTAKAFANEPLELERFMRKSNELMRVRNESFGILSYFNGTITFFTNITNLVVLVCGGVMVADGQLPLSDFVAFVIVSVGGVYHGLRQC